MSDLSAATAAIFTTNRVKAAPVIVSRWHLQKSRHRMRAIIVNAGNANCSTGPNGIPDAGVTASTVACRLKCDPSEVIVCSTGVIGVPLPVVKILRAVPDLVGSLALTPKAFAAVTRAIMTTDTRPKWAAASCRIGGRPVRLLGCAKGAGMIHPRMATMLAFVLTDTAISAARLQRAVRNVASRTFNAITVDGDTSTNDTFAVMANGASGTRVDSREDYSRFVRALEEVCRSLALAIVADGEGARRVIELEVRGATNHNVAAQIARTVATSPLVKTALAGADPNWGRILAAAGRAGVAFDPARVEVVLAGIPVCRLGSAYPFDERVAHRKLLASYVPIVVDLHQGPASAHIWTCDLTADYVRINASYRT